MKRKIIVLSEIEIYHTLSLINLVAIAGIFLILTPYNIIMVLIDFDFQKDLIHSQELSNELFGLVFNQSSFIFLILFVMTLNKDFSSYQFHKKLTNGFTVELLFISKIILIFLFLLLFYSFFVLIYIFVFHFLEVEFVWFDIYNTFVFFTWPILCFIISLFIFSLTNKAVYTVMIFLGYMVLEAVFYKLTDIDWLFLPFYSFAMISTKVLTWKLLVLIIGYLLLFFFLSYKRFKTKDYFI